MPNGNIVLIAVARLCLGRHVHDHTGVDRLHDLHNAAFAGGGADGHKPGTLQFPHMERDGAVCQRKRLRQIVHAHFFLINQFHDPQAHGGTQCLEHFLGILQ